MSNKSELVAMAYLAKVKPKKYSLGKWRHSVGNYVSIYDYYKITLLEYGWQRGGVKGWNNYHSVSSVLLRGLK